MKKDWLQSCPGLTLSNTVNNLRPPFLAGGVRKKWRLTENLNGLFPQCLADRGWCGSLTESAISFTQIHHKPRAVTHNGIYKWHEEKHSSKTISLNLCLVVCPLTSASFRKVVQDFIFIFFLNTSMRHLGKPGWKYAKSSFDETLILRTYTDTSG